LESKKSCQPEHREQGRSIGTFQIGDAVRVRSIDEAEAKELAESNGGWVESMRDSLGRLGVVTDVAKGGKMVRVKTAPPYIGSTYKQWWWWWSARALEK